MHKYKYYIELLTYAAIIGAGMWFFVTVDAFENLNKLTRAYEAYDLDEFIMLIPLLLFCAAVFSWRRMRDLSRQKKALGQSRDDLSKMCLRLEELSRFREKFLLRACDELRRPLHAVSDYLKEVTPPKDQGNLKALHDVDSAVENMLAVVDDTASSVLRPNRRGSAERVIVSDLLESVRLATQLHADNKGLSFHVTRAEDMPSCFNCEAGPLRLALSAVVSNAIKYTPSGRVMVYGSFEPEKHGKLVFTVSDTGIGISSKQLETIFDPYVQEGCVPENLNDCFGVGLPLACKLLEGCGGSISATSAQGQGSEFTIALPATPA